MAFSGVDNESANMPFSSNCDGDKEKQARENHCEIERRRRIKMAAYFNELCDMVPACSNLARKPDKLTILRMASQHMRQLRGNSMMNADGTFKPSFLTDQEFKHLVVEAVDGFLIVIQCDTGRLLFVSDAIQYVLHHLQSDCYGRAIYEFLHPDDREKVRNQLVFKDSNLPARILDMKTGTVKREGNIRHFCGSRLSFICRMRVGHRYSTDSYERSTIRRKISANDGQLYDVVNFSGYLKNCVPVDRISDEIGSVLFVALARLIPESTPSIDEMLVSSSPHFTSRNKICGKFKFVDQKCYEILGFYPHELIDKSIFDFCYKEDVNKVKDSFNKAVCAKGDSFTVLSKLKSNLVGDYIEFHCTFNAFVNPYSEQIEFIVCSFSPVRSMQAQKPPDMNATDFYSLGLHSSIDGISNYNHCTCTQAPVSTIVPNPSVNQWMDCTQQIEPPYMAQQFAPANMLPYCPKSGDDYFPNQMWTSFVNGTDPFSNSDVEMTRIMENNHLSDNLCYNELNQMFSGSNYSL